jgi:hypothetical protein
MRHWPRLPLVAALLLFLGAAGPASAQGTSKDAQCFVADDK